MTLNQASRKLDSDLLLAVNGSGLPLRVVELQVINLLNAVQMRLRQEEEKEAADEAAEAAKRAKARPAETAAPAQPDAAPDGDAHARATAARFSSKANRRATTTTGATEARAIPAPYKNAGTA